MGNGPDRNGSAVTVSNAWHSREVQRILPGVLRGALIRDLSRLSLPLPLRAFGAHGRDG